jgi:hypothetical protein
MRGTLWVPTLRAKPKHSKPLTRIHLPHATESIARALRRRGGCSCSQRPHQASGDVAGAHVGAGVAAEAGAGAGVGVTTLDQTVVRSRFPKHVCHIAPVRCSPATRW